METSKRVHHNGQLVRLFLPDGSFGPPGLRTMRQTIGMQRDRAVFDSLAAHELRIRVIDHFVRHDVRMTVRCGHGLGVEIEWTRTKRTHNEAVALKCLMSGRWQVEPSDARFE